MNIQGKVDVVLYHLILQGAWLGSENFLSHTSKKVRDQKLSKENYNHI